MSKPTKSDLYSMIETVMWAVRENSENQWHPNPEVDQDDWSEDAPVQLQLTVKECRQIKDALIADRRLPKHWSGQGDSIALRRLAKQEEANLIAELDKQCPFKRKSLLCVDCETRCVHVGEVDPHGQEESDDE